jgi:FkbM family methyltransferase
VTSPAPGHDARLPRVASLPAMGYPLLLAWQKGWLRAPSGVACVRLKDGRTLRCDLSDRTQRTMYLGLFEPGETRLASRLLGPGDVFIDVGAHIGWFTTMAARRIQARGRVIACEPYPANVWALRENLSINEIHNVQVVEAAISHGEGTLRLAKGPDSGSVTALDWAHDDPAEVPTMALDELAQDARDIRLIKVDVEGWEAHVLRGATQTLRRTENVLIEINRPALKKSGSEPEGILQLLRLSGFTTFCEVPRSGLRRFASGEVTNILVGR